MKKKQEKFDIESLKKTKPAKIKGNQLELAANEMIEAYKNENYKYFLEILNVVSNKLDCPLIRYNPGRYIGERVGKQLSEITSIIDTCIRVSVPYNNLTSVKNFSIENSNILDCDDIDWDEKKFNCALRSSLFSSRFPFKLTMDNFKKFLSKFYEGKISLYEFVGLKKFDVKNSITSLNIILDKNFYKKSLQLNIKAFIKYCRFNEKIINILYENLKSNSPSHIIYLCDELKKNSKVLDNLDKTKLNSDLMVLMEVSR